MLLLFLFQRAGSVSLGWCIGHRFCTLSALITESRPAVSHILARSRLASAVSVGLRRMAPSPSLKKALPRPTCSTPATMPAPHGPRVGPWQSTSPFRAPSRFALSTCCGSRGPSTFWTGASGGSTHCAPCGVNSELRLRSHVHRVLLSLARLLWHGSRLMRNRVHREQQFRTSCNFFAEKKLSTCENVQLPTMFALVKYAGRRMPKVTTLAFVTCS